MKRVLILVAAVALPCSLSGCGGDTRSSLMKQLVATVNEVADTLATIKDQASAEAAKPKLKALGERYRDIDKRGKALKEPTPEEKTALEKEYAEPLKSAYGRLLSEMLRVAFVPGGKEALQEMGEIKRN